MKSIYEIDNNIKRRTLLVLVFIPYVVLLSLAYMIDYFLNINDSLISEDIKYFGKAWNRR